MNAKVRSLLLVVVLLLVVIGGFVLVGDKFFTKKATVSGIIDYNGTTPAGSSIAVGVRKLGEATYTIFLSGVAPSSGSSWSWPDGLSGSAYEFQAYLQVNGQNVSVSQPIQVAAPATDEVLVINSTSQPSQKSAAISGTVGMNGSVPAGSTIAIGTKSPAESQYNIVLTGLPATDNVAWTWAGATEGSLYDVKAFLQVNGSNLYESETEQVAAPATDEVLTLNARTVSPTPTQAPNPAAPTPVPNPATIQGSINMNGPSPSGSSIVIAARITGTSQFSIVATNIGSGNGSNWSWNSALSGNTYDVQAWVQVNNSTQLQSQILTVTAPAANEVLTINNASVQYPAPPSNSIANNCLNANNNQWQVHFGYNINAAIQNNPQQFNLTVGTSNQGTQMVSNTTSPSNPNQQQNYTSGYVFNPNQTYYVQYAYSPCTNCNIWSAYTSSQQFSCSTPPTITPTPTNTPTPMNTPTPTPVILPTNTPTPTPTLAPLTSSCNQTCGSNGYNCVTGLQCASGYLPGSQVCRNPNCTDQSDCNCRLLNSVQ